MVKINNYKKLNIQLLFFID